MKRTAFIFIIAAGLISQTALHAQDTPAHDGPWTLTDCIDHALKNNLSIRQSEISVQQREIELSTAKSRMLPSANASASEN